MKYEGAIIRPPSEAESLILQITVGCSHSRCTFCPSYKAKRFRIKTFQEIQEDIDEAAQFGRAIERVFLADGDALIVPQPRLREIMDYLNEKLPGLRRVGTYANAKGVLKKTADELRGLKEAGLGIIYLGVESGDQVVLDRIKKGTTYERLLQAGRMVKAAGIKLSVTVLLGIGGSERSREHAVATGRILTEMGPLGDDRPRHPPLRGAGAGAFRPPDTLRIDRRAEEHDCAYRHARPLLLQPCLQLPPSQGEDAQG